MVDFNATQPVSDPAFFVGRRKILEALQDYTRSTVLIGEARIGKTSLLLQLKRDLESFSHKLIPRVTFYFDLSNPRFRRPADVYRAIAAYLKGDLKRSDNFKFPDTEGVSSSPTWLLRFFEDLDADGLRLEVVLLVDNIDNPEAFLSERLTLYSGLRQLIDFSPNGFSLKLIASAKASFLTFETATVSKLLSRLQIVTLEALSLEEAQRLMGNSKIFDAAPQAKVLQEYLFDQCGGHPSLLQEVLATVTSGVSDKRSLRAVIEKSCDELAERGGNFFQEYMDSLVYEEIICLLGMVLRLRDEEWYPPVLVARKFLTAGLIRETPQGRLEASCKIFFRWFRHNVLRILPSVDQVGPMKADHDFIVDLLQDKLHPSMSRSKIISEKLLQDVIEVMLITVGIQAEREVTFYYREKAYRSDFVIPNLGIALEIKLAKSSRQIGLIIDQLEADLNAYQANYRYILVVIYDLTGSSRLFRYTTASQNPFVRYVVVRASTDEEVELGGRNGQ